MSRPSDAEMLEVVEAMIEQQRHERGTHLTFLTLRAVAADLRARLPGANSEAQGALQKAIDGCIASKTALGYERGHVQRVGEELIARWAIVRLALERMDKN